jgi:hypothetical protein
MTVGAAPTEAECAFGVLIMTGGLPVLPVMANAPGPVKGPRCNTYGDRWVSSLTFIQAARPGSRRPAKPGTRASAAISLAKTLGDDHPDTQWARRAARL